MAINNIKKQYMSKENAFYQKNYHYFLIAIIALIGLFFVMLSAVVYELDHRPQQEFAAQNGEDRLVLQSFDEPNLMPATIINFASKAASIAYTFDFNNYEAQIEEARPFFTDNGWSDFQSSAKPLLDTITKNQLFVYGVVAGTPVIINQGPLPGVDYAWRVQIPFLVTYTSASATTKKSYYVSITIVQVPTSQNPQGIGIEQFVMTS